jgi:pimeloyl-ACP methyl ester carboxylesterase
MNGQEAQHATSADGTRISYWCFGDGPPILIVHGLGSTHTPYEPFAEVLGHGFTGCAMDRRGRGGSGDTMPYALEREFEDVVAVAAQLGRVVVIGYSFGGPAAIEAATASDAVRGLILVEAWASPLSEIPAEVTDEIERLVSLGRYVDAFNHGDSAEEIEQSRQLPNYAERVAIVLLTPREIRGWQRYWQEHPIDNERWRTLDKPVLLVVSEANRDGMEPPALRLAARLPQATVQVLGVRDTLPTARRRMCWLLRSAPGSKRWPQTIDRGA